MDIVVCQSRRIDTMPTAFSTVPQQAWVCRLSTASTADTANLPFRSMEIQIITTDSGGLDIVPDRARADRFALL